MAAAPTPRIAAGTFAPTVPRPAVLRRRWRSKRRPSPSRRSSSGHRWSRAAFAAFVLHQVVLVGIVLASHAVTWPPELEYLSGAALGVVASFALGSLALRLPGVARVV